MNRKSSQDREQAQALVTGPHGVRVARLSCDPYFSGTRDFIRVPRRSPSEGVYWASFLESRPDPKDGLAQKKCVPPIPAKRLW